MAARTKKSPELLAQLVHGYAIGLSMETAAEAVGINRETVRRWALGDPNFAEDLKRARSRKIGQYLTILDEQKDPVHMRWWLSKMCPEQFGNKITVRRELVHVAPRESKLRDFLRTDPAASKAFTTLLRAVRACGRLDPEAALEAELEIATIAASTPPATVALPAAEEDAPAPHSARERTPETAPIRARLRTRA